MFLELYIWSYIFRVFFFFNIYIHVGGVTVVEVACQEKQSSEEMRTNTKVSE